MTFRRLVLCASLFVSGLASAQFDVPSPQPLFGMRSTAISQDGKRIAFVWRGDIWVVGSEGGRAVPVTNHIEMDDNPVWSPDGNWIAFSSNRFGNNDIFIVPADGGATVRVTYFPGSDVPGDWSADGRQILFASQREKEERGLYSIDLKTGKLSELMLDFMGLGRPQVSADGSQVVMTRSGFPVTRPRYQGSAASQIWTFDMRNGKRAAVRDNEFQNLWPTFGPDNSIYAVTVAEKTPSSGTLAKPNTGFTDNESRTPNVYRLSGNKSTRLTNFVGDPVRWLSVARKTGDMAFIQDGNLWTAKPGTAPRKLTVTASIDDKMTTTERLILTGEATDQALDAKNERFAFVVRDEIWTVPIKKEKGPNADDAVQVTRYPGLDRNPIWHPDGKSMFFVSDRSGAERLYRIPVGSSEATPISAAESDVTLVQFTHDKKNLTYWQTGRQGGLFKVGIDSTAPSKVMELPGEFKWGDSPQYDFSPDERYIAYAHTVRDVRNIWVYDTVTKVKHNVTQLNAGHDQPRFSPDGKYLYFLSNRESDGIYALALQPEDARPEESDAKYEKPKTTPKVEFDWEDTRNRVRKIVTQGVQGTFAVDPETGNLLFASGGELHKANFDGTDVKRITNGAGIGGFDLSQDGNFITYINGGLPSYFDWRKDNQPIQRITFRSDWTRDLRGERLAAYNQVWREYNRSFYDPNFHGRNWRALKEKYLPYLSSVEHRNEMATVLNMMIGELESSHSEVGPAGGNPRSASIGHPGFTLDYSYRGPGLRIASVPPRTPGSYKKTLLKAGEYVMQINGRDVSPDETLWNEVLSEQAGRNITLTVNATASKAGARQVKIRALNTGEWGNILYNNRIYGRRATVDKASKGQIAYLHIAGMGGGNFDQFMREAWQEIQGKKAVIIDVRNNGGGNISDRLIDMIERLPHSYYQGRDDEPILAPGQSWNLPTVVLLNEGSFSNAEMFPYAMKARRLATLVGMPTPGYVIWTYELRLVDGTSARMPTAGVFRLDGTPLENMGQQPDIRVPMSFEDYASNRDPQLAKAIEILSKSAGK